MSEETRQILEKLDNMDKRLDSMDVRFGNMDARFGNMDARLDSMDARLDNMDARFDNMDARLGNMDARLDNMDSRLDDTIAKLTDIQMTLEVETNRNIKIIAEGHLDLSRKFDEVVKIESEKEMFLIRMNHMENGLRRVQERMEAFA